MTVKCPSCGDEAIIIFYPSESNTPIPFPTNKQDREILEKLGVDLSTPRYDDLHFLCMNCTKTAKTCEFFKQKCLLKPPEGM